MSVGGQEGLNPRPRDGTQAQPPSLPDGSTLSTWGSSGGPGSPQKLAPPPSSGNSQRKQGQRPHAVFVIPRLPLPAHHPASRPSRQAERGPRGLRLRSAVVKPKCQGRRHEGWEAEGRGRHNPLGEGAAGRPSLGTWVVAVARADTGTVGGRPGLPGH